jgi:hypothetical protein
MRNVTVLSATLACGLLFTSMASCGDDGGEALTVAATSTTSGTGGSDGGSGGTSTATTGGAGGTSTTSTGGIGGSGGMPEQPLNGCLSTSTTDMTNQQTVSLTNPLTQPLCITVSVNTMIDVDGTGSQPGPLIVGGTYDATLDQKSYDATSPIQPSCYNCTLYAPACWDPNANTCYTGSTWTLSSQGAFPFYDNSNPAANRGVVYVVP